MSDIFRIGSGADHVEIRRVGAELAVWSVAEKNVLWALDPAIWARTSPVLFPIVGRARNGMISIGGRKHAMSIHGFAAETLFSVVAEAKDSISLRLADTPGTRAAFPFPFQLDITYRVAPCRLEVTFVVTNTGEEPLPYALGWHPGFAWPFSMGRRDQYVISFERPERAKVPVITPDGLFSTRLRSVPVVGQTLALTEELLANEALCFLEAESRSLRFIAPDGDAVRMELQNFPHIALWSRPPGSFLCIEAWTGHGDPEGFDGDIREKPSMRSLPAGAAATHAIRLIYEAAR